MLHRSHFVCVCQHVEACLCVRALSDTNPVSVMLMLFKNITSKYFVYSSNNFCNSGGICLETFHNHKFSNNHISLLLFGDLFT